MIDFKELQTLIGKPIQNEEIKSYFELHKIKYPKKDTISNRASNRYFWVEDKKRGLNFHFSIELNNQKYFPIAGERKGVFIPILTFIQFGKKAKIEFPKGISLTPSLEELREKLGKPTLEREYGLGMFNIWDIVLSEKEDIIFQAMCTLRDGHVALYLRIKEDRPLIKLYDKLGGETIDTVVKAQVSFYTKGELFFIHWAITNNFLTLNNQEPQGVDKLKKGEITIVDFVTQNLGDVSCLSLEDFTNIDVVFINKYWSNLSGHDIVFQRDFAYTFLKDESLKDNYLGEVAFEEMRKVEYTPENHKLIEDVINNRYREYQEHRFENSEPNL